MPQNLNDFYVFLDHVTRRRRAWFFFKNLLLFLVLCGLFFYLLNFPALTLQFKFWAKPQSIALPKKIHGSDILEQTAPAELKKELPYPNDTLAIESIGVNSPIIWDSNTDNIEENLKHGVVQLSGSGYPGERSNVFITGHSSNFWWREGDYNSVFALLGNLTAGDEIVVVKDSKVYTYEVLELHKINPDEVGQFAEPTSKPTLTLMTCWPIGTNWKRLIVQAEALTAD